MRETCGMGVGEGSANDFPALVRSRQGRKGGDIFWILRDKDKHFLELKQILNLKFLIRLFLHP